MADLNSDFLDDESFLESEGHLLQGQGQPILKHSATTDTLDSVLLETSQFEDELQADIVLEEENPESVDGIEEKHPRDAVIEGGNVEGGIHDKDPNSPMKISSYFKTEQPDDTDLLQDASFFDELGEVTQIDAPDKEASQGEPLLSQSDDVDIESAVDSALQVESLSPENLQSDVQNEAGYSTLVHTKQREVIHDTIEAKLSVEAESVDFQAVLEDETNILEASVEVIDDKEDFEHFTAEADTDIDQDFGLSMSPGSKVLADKMGKMQLTDTIPVDTTDPTPLNYNRQFSTSSNHSNGHPATNSPIHQPFQGSLLPSISPYHQPLHAELSSQPQGLSPLHHAQPSNKQEQGKLPRPSVCLSVV